MTGTYKSNLPDGHVFYDVSALGSSLKILKRRKVQLTHALATKILEFEEFAGDRSLKNGHVDYLVGTMMRGTFHPEWVTLITCQYDGKTYRMNGQHTCWARLEMEKKWPCEVECIEYKAETIDDLRMLYASIDRSSPRTKQNVIDSYLQGTEEFSQVKKQTLKKIPSGYALYKWSASSERRRHDGDAIAYLLRTDDYDLAIKVCSFLDTLSPRTSKHMFRASVVAGMFATFNKAPQISKDFWEPISNGVGFKKATDPRNKLRTELLQAAVNSGGGASSNKKRVSAEHMLRSCILCWNAFRQGRTLQYLRSTEKGRRPALK